MPQNTGGKPRDYRESDVFLVLHRRGGGDWRSWMDVVRWLHMNGADDGDLRQQQVAAMMDDFEQLARDGVPFTDDSGAAYRLAREHRRAEHGGRHRKEMPHRVHEPMPRV